MEEKKGNKKDKETQAVVNGLKRQLDEARSRIADLTQIEKSVFESSREGIMILDRRARILNVNDSFCEMMGVSREKIVGKSGVSLAKKFLKPKDLPRILSIIANVMRDKDIPVFEVNFEDKIFEVHNPKVVSGSKTFVCYFRDITSRNAVDSLLRESEAKISGIFRSAPVGIGLAVEGRLTQVNDKLCQITGLNSGELVGKTPQLLFSKPADYEQAIDRCRSGRSSRSGSFEIKWRRKDGRMLDLLIGVTFMKSSPAASGVCFGVFDVTEYKKAEEALINAQRLESIGVLAGGLAHDFNNLLTGLFGYIELARMSQSESEINRFLDKAMAVFTRAQDLTQQLLTFSKGGRPVRSTINLTAIVRETVYFVLSGSSVKADFVADPNLWACDADENQIRQVVDNIVINSRQVMSSGGRIRISLRNLEAGAGLPSGVPAGRYVRISIEDEGPGVPPEIRERIFEPFFTTKKEGSGLGLAIAYSIVRKHDGHMILESKPGSGALFHIFLPASCAKLSVIHEKQMISHSGEGRILLMDDESSIREIGSRMLKSMGYEVVCANDGAQAVWLFRKSVREAEPIDIVILDLTVAGGMSGREAVLEIRKMAQDVLAIVSSGYSEDPILGDPVSYGFDAALTKPYDLSRMGQVLETLVFSRLKSSRNRSET